MVIKNKETEENNSINYSKLTLSFPSLQVLSLSLALGLALSWEATS